MHMHTHVHTNTDGYRVYTGWVKTVLAQSFGMKLALPLKCSLCCSTMFDEVDKIQT